MSTSAWITMSIAWVVIGFFMLKFLIKVLKTPMKKDEPEQSIEK